MRARLTLMNALLRNAAALAMPSSTALRKCPEIIFVPPRFEVYRAILHQIRSIFADYTPLIEPLSLDKAYLDVTQNLRRISTASATAKETARRLGHAPHAR